jgi:hypothetical protein
MNMAISLPPAAMPPAPPSIAHDVTIVTTRKLAQARVMGMPPEEFGIERGARSIGDCRSDELGSAQKHALATLAQLEMVRTRRDSIVQLRKRGE